MLPIVENGRRKQLAWVHAILSHQRWTATNLAREAGIDHSTIIKFLNDPLNAAQLRLSTVEKIERAGGIQAYQTQPSSAPRGLAEDEAVPYEAEQDDYINRAIAAIKAGRNGVDPWQLNSRALENAGLLPGDILLIDLNANPVDGDVVCAQVYDSSGRAETVMRLYEKPFLVTATTDNTLRRPLLVDDDRVKVRGVMLTPLRPRRAA